MKNVQFFFAGLFLLVLASCGGNTQNAEQQTESTVNTTVEAVQDSVQDSVVDSTAIDTTQVK
ncbi:MAG: hypothetical protein SNJ71_04890 [Bacteroidales bacterium]